MDGPILGLVGMMWVNKEHRLKQGSTGLNLQNIMRRVRLFGSSLTNNFILFMCYANQFYALNETDMSSSIWNYNDETPSK